MRLFHSSLVLLLSSCAVAAEPARDRFGEPLPSDAILRLGGLHLRHAKPALGLAFGVAGKTLATASLDGNVYLWDIQTGKKARTVSADCPAGLSAVRWTENGKSLCAAGRDGLIHLLNIEKASGRTLGKDRVPLLGLDASRDGKILIAVDQQGRVRLWNRGED